MDTFVTVLGIVGIVLLVLGFVVLIQSIIGIFKKRTPVKSFLTSLLIFLITVGFGLAFTAIAMFVYTFARFSHEEKIGYVFAEARGDTIAMTFFNKKEDRSHFFKLTGDQWMIEGYILRWKTSLRWLGAESYYCITRFEGRDVDGSGSDAVCSNIYQIENETGFWRYMLKNFKKIPFVDAAYGTAAFQYPSPEPYDLYINDTGFIIKKK
jgi:hypothetical protein